jgi:hypothetical protein
MADHRRSTAGHRLQPDDLVVLNDGRTGAVAWCFTGAEPHWRRGWVAWLLVDGAGATPAETDAAWRLLFGRRHRGRRAWGDRLMVRPEQIRQVIPRLRGHG